MALTPLQARFVEEYLCDLNATRAYVRAGYKARGHAAETNAARLLRNAEVAAAVRAAQAARSKRTEVTQDAVLNELRRIAFLDPRKVMTWGPDRVTFLPSDTLTDDEAACVVEASQTVTETGGTIRVKLADKVAALTLLGKHLGLFQEAPAPPPAVAVNVGVPFDPSQYTDAELRQLRDLLGRTGGPGPDRGTEGR